MARTVTRNQAAQLAQLRTIAEAGRVLSGDNEGIVAAILETAKRIGAHNPGAAEVVKLCEELLARARAAADAAVVEAAPGDGTPAPAADTPAAPAQEPTTCEACGMAPGDADPAICEAAGAGCAVAKMKAAVEEAIASGRIVPGGSALHREADAAMAAAGLWVREAVDGKAGKVWRITVIREGMSANGRLWPRAMVELLATMIDGVDVFEDHDSARDAQAYPVRRVGDKIGFLSNRALVTEADGTVRLDADFNVVTEAWRQNLRNAWELGRRDFVEFSVNALGDDPQRMVNGRKVRVMEALHAVRSVDAVTVGAAGGRLLDIKEHLDLEVQMTPDELKAMVADTVKATMAEVSAAQASTPTPDPAPAADPVTEAPAPVVAEPVTAAAPDVATAATAVQEAVATAAAAQKALAEVQALQATMAAEARRQASANVITEALAAAKLPPTAAAAARKALTDLAERRAVTAEDAAATIGEWRDIAAAFVQEAPQTFGGRVHGYGAPMDAYQLRLRGMLRGQAYTGADGVAIKPFRSIREAWCAFNPQADPWDSGASRAMFRSIQGSRYDSETDHKRIQESITTSQWGEVFGDNMYIALLDAYRALPYDEWRKLITIDPNVDNFRTRHYTRVGGYGDLSNVAEGAAYQPMTSPTDDEVAWAVTKRGGLEASITLEAIANDDVGALQRIPGGLADAAKRTLYKFFMNLLTTDNPTLDYDSVALYHAGSHGNSGTTALSVAGLAAVETAMREQTARLNTSDVLGPRNTPKYVVVPNELKNRAQRILAPSPAYAYALSSTPDADTSMDPGAYAGSGIEALVYDYLTNAKDWWTFRDPANGAIAVGGFFAGKEEPEIFIQNDPNSGTGFSNDTEAIKVRHIYGGEVVDHTGCYYQDVA